MVVVVVEKGLVKLRLSCWGWEEEESAKRWERVELNPTQLLLSFLGRSFRR